MNIKHLLATAALLFVTNVSNAGAPLWTMTPLTATTISVASDSTAMVQYSVTNNSRKDKTLVMKPIAGITQVTSGVPTIMSPVAGCPDPFTLAYHESCTLMLRVSGSALPEGGLVGGPILCVAGSELQCYQPSIANSLAITKTAAPAKPSITVNPTELNIQRCYNSGSVTVTNTSSSITVENLEATIPSESQITLNDSSTCVSMLAPGQSCVLGFTSGFSAENGTSISISGSNTAAAVNLIVQVTSLPTSILPPGSTPVQQINNSDLTVCFM